MLRTENFRILVIDDVALVAESVRRRVGSAAKSSPVTTRDPFVVSMSVNSSDVTAEVKRIQDKINDDEINFLVLDRGIADRMEERRDAPERPGKITSYLRRRDASYKDVIEMLDDLSVTSKRRIKGLIIYTLDEAEPDSPWFVDPAGMAQRIRSVFESLPFVDIIRTGSDIYWTSGLKLFRPRDDNGLEEEAKAGDLILYGMLVGEIVWARIERMLFSREKVRQSALRGWFLRNYFLFLAVTAGLGIGVSAAYELLRGTFNTPWAALVIAVALGIVFPVGMLLAEPRILLPPDTMES